MGRSATMSPLGLYNWDNTVFDLMQIPSAMNRDTLIENLLAETSELEVLYPNPIVFKNLVGVWSVKQIDIWNRLYATTQYEYNPIENYNRVETGTDGGTSRVIHSGTDTNADTTTYSGSNGRTEAITQGGTDTQTRQSAEGGSDTISRQRAEGGTDSDQTTLQSATGGSDAVTTADKKGHWIAGYDSSATAQNDGLVKQTRDEDDNTVTSTYGKTESSNANKTTTYGKTETVADTTNYGKTESSSDTTNYGKTENVSETMTFGQTVQRAGNTTHGEQIDTTNTGTKELHARGNIGVTTTQEMIRQQRSIELFNLYDIIIEDFKMRFCILVY